VSFHTPHLFFHSLRFRKRGSLEWDYVSGSFVMVWACNVPWLTTSVQMAPHARFDDGCADVVIVQQASRSALLASFVDGTVERGKHVEADWCRYEKVCFLRESAPRCIQGSSLLGSQSHSRISSLCVCARVPFVYTPSVNATTLIPRCATVALRGVSCRACCAGFYSYLARFINTVTLICVCCCLI